MFNVQRSVPIEGVHEREPLLEEGLRKRIIESSQIRFYRGDISDHDARRLVQLNYRCLYPGRPPENLEEESQNIRFNLKHGMRITVLEYAGDAEIPLPLGRGRLVRDGQIGYNVCKRTSFFDADSLGWALETVRAGGNVKWEELVARGFPKDYSAASEFRGDRLDGKAGFLMFITVIHPLRRLHLADPIIQATLSDFKAEGLDYAVAYARMPRYVESVKERWRDRDTLEGYAKAVDEKGFSPDWGLRFHQKAGGRSICAIPDCATDDIISGGHGALVVYDLTGANGRKT